MRFNAKSMPCRGAAEGAEARGAVEISEEERVDEADGDVLDFSPLIPGKGISRKV